MTLLARAWIAAFGAALFLWAPRAARACAVCTSATEETSRLAFILTTIFLSALPLLMVGGVVWWLWRRTRDLERDPAGGESRIREPAVSRASSSL